MNDIPVFGLPGNPAAAYVGFEMIIRPALRKMQGYTHFERPHVRARLTAMSKRRIRAASLCDRRSTATPRAPTRWSRRRTQSSGLFGVIQRSNCMAIMPEGLEGCTAGSLVECVLLDVPEEIVL